MNECKNIDDFVKNKNLNTINIIYKCNCNYCKYYDNRYNLLYEKIRNPDNYISFSLHNNINLIWTNSMIFIKKYLLIFEKYSNL